MHPILAHRGRLGLYLAAWAPLGGLLTVLLAAVSETGGWGAWAPALVLSLPLALVYAFICLAAWNPCRSTPLETAGPSRLVATHGAGAVLSSGLWLALGWGWAGLAAGAGGALAGTRDLYRTALPLFLAAGALLYLLAVAVHYLLIAFEAARAAEARTLRLKVLAREAELKALRTQIDPHFLFNSLNAVASLAGSDPPAARRTALMLADFLRRSLRLAEHESVPLREELEAVRAYLEIERVRFGERLRVEESIAAGVEELPVPPLILQPLIENAAKHGIARRLEGGTVILEAARRAGGLLLAVTNETDPEAGAGGVGGGRGEGIGLANVRRRLDAAYEHRARLTAAPGPEGFRAELVLPAGEPAAGGGR